MFLSTVAHKSFCLKFSGLISNLKILKKSYLSPRTFNVQTYIWFLFKAKKILCCANEAFQIILIQGHKKFAGLFFQPACNKKFQWAKKMWQRLCRMEMIHPMIGWRRDEHGTHKHTQLVDSLICIKCLLENNAFSVLHYVMVALHYSMLHRYKDFFCPWDNHARLY